MLGEVVMWLAGAIVAASGLWLVGLATMIFAAPVRAERFIRGFASSARTHYAEQSLRLIAGVAIIIFAPEMRFPRPIPDFWMAFGIDCHRSALYPVAVASAIRPMGDSDGDQVFETLCARCLGSWRVRPIWNAVEPRL